LEISLPRSSLPHLVTDADSLIALPFDPNQPALRLLQRYVEILLGPDGIDDDPLLAVHIETTLLDLIALALGAGRDAADMAAMRGLRAARLQTVLTEIKAGCADPAFSAHDVARRLGLSPRYIQDLLQESGASFSERVLELRLQKARAMLASLRYRHAQISQIAYACGFNQVPYFNRCFRRRFGAAPTEYRGGVWV
jgi:AraC-like DNA-binding protein